MPGSYGKSATRTNALPSASGAAFHHPAASFIRKKEVATVVHGDEFTALGGAAEVDWYESMLKTSFELKVKGCLGEISPT